jgi:cutinase
MLHFVLALWSFLGLTLASPVPAKSLSNRDLVKKETSLNAFLTVLLEFLPAINGDISSVAGVLTDFEDLLVDVTGLQTTYNQLGAGPCTEYTLIFARGTTEPGNVGILVGPPFYLALQNLVGSSAITFQGVNDYAASIDGYLEGGEPAAGVEM